MKINLTKIIVLVSAVVIAISACYYFIIFIPSEKLLSRQIECKRIAQEMYDKSVKKQKQDMEETSRELFEFFYYTISRPFYNFSKKMNTCLYKIGFEGGTNNHSRNCSVVDVYTNSKIISYEITYNNVDTKISLDNQKEYDEFLLSEKELTGDGDCIFP